MTNAIVIAVAADRMTFAVETEDGTCAVLLRRDGPAVDAGDVVSGSVTARGPQLLRHEAGACAVDGQSGPISREEALAQMLGSRGTQSGDEGYVRRGHTSRSG
jgi:hypothetical protein